MTEDGVAGHAAARRRLATAIRRLERVGATRTLLARLRLLQLVEAALLAVAGTLREEIASLTGEVLHPHERRG